FVNLPMRRRLLDQARDPLMTPPAPTQPDPTLALHDGETLTLCRHQPLKSLLGVFVFTPILGALIAFSGEMAIFSVIPTFGRTSLNPFYDAFLDNLAPPPAPTALDWFAVAFPIALGLLLTLLMMVGALSQWRERIT